METGLAEIIAMATLGAYSPLALAAAWQALLRAREDEDGPAACAPWRQQWDAHQAQNLLALQQFNDAVARYNAAIAQFPPCLLAWLFGFKPARPL